MYIPKLFREEDRDEILSFLHQNNFAAVVSFDGQRPLATHTPVEVVERGDGGLEVYGHFSRANPQRHTLEGQEVLLIFQGPHTYISPRWYDHVNVPTWNYMIVHVYGQAREVAGQELHSLLSRLVQRHEATSAYRLEGLPEEFVQKEIQGVYGFAVEVSRVDAGYKLSQNRSDEDYQNITRHLDARQDEHSRQIAHAMRKLRKPVS